MSESIPVPPGFTVAEYLDAQEFAVKLRIVSGVVLALFLWDYLVLLPRELLLYRHLTRSTLRLPAFWCFVVLRYAPFLATAPAIALSSFNLSDCQRASNVSSAGVLLMVAAAGGIFVLRVLAFMNVHPAALFGFRSSNSRGAITLPRRIAALVLIALYIVNVGVWIAVLPGLSFATGPPTPYGSNCINPHTYGWSAASYGASLIFECYVLICTIVASHRSRDGASQGIMRIVLRDGVLYFAFATAAYLVTFAMNLLPQNKSYLKAFATAFASFAITTMGQRVFLNLRLSGIETRALKHFFPSSSGDPSTGDSVGKGFAAAQQLHLPLHQQPSLHRGSARIHVSPITAQWQEKSDDVYTVAAPMRAYRSSAAAERVFPVLAESPLYADPNSPDPSDAYVTAAPFLS